MDLKKIRAMLYLSREAEDYDILFTVHNRIKYGLHLARTQSDGNVELSNFPCNGIQFENEIMIFYKSFLNIVCKDFDWMRVCSLLEKEGVMIKDDEGYYISERTMKNFNDTRQTVNAAGFILKNVWDRRDGLQY